ncbi:histone-lysine N-methyltransferase EZ3 isoform X2 [Aristolochia californica]|uniref:histone-lysine N-methyltransferase EZ3 isoform X2 n=1 Tax=Aristolochia californica TaxID=171875 RepID=UPI0035D7E86B
MDIFRQHRNQRMAEDQSVVGRRQIYYDPCGSEALICSDSEEEISEPVEEKHEFSEGGEQILWQVLQEYGLKPEVLNILSQAIEANPSEIQERYEMLMEKHQLNYVKDSEGFGEIVHEKQVLLDKTLSSALDSFDNLFCRRCLVFDCRLHGCSQTLIIPSEKQSIGCELEDGGKPCSEQCYLWGREGNRLSHTTKTSQNIDDGMGNVAYIENDVTTNIEEITSPENMGKRKAINYSMLATNEASITSITKKQKTVDSPETASDLVAGKMAESTSGVHPNIGIEFPIAMQSFYSGKGELEADVAENSWSPIEKELYMKGIEIFGRNSCLIARNLLPGLRSCMEVFSYMFNDAEAASNRTSTLPTLTLDDKGKNELEYMEQEIPTRTRFFRRRGRARKLKYTWKSAGHMSIRKRIADGKQQSCRQYTPCGCQLMCGKQCPCLHNGTCCEKYCGCSKSCKNRFRGCHCAKSQCRSRQCPCFAAGRECDPDVCRNCWVSCGGGSLGEPPARGDGYQCGNMKLLLKQQQRILLGKSDVAGWGAFIKNPVNKNDYLGEYTGELISHKEADKRGKIYDRANSSFLFDLNDQYVLDAYRKGDKLKFANHSSNPNCYAKVMLVAGDHRVGIFAKEQIEASEELFYDYRYGPDQAPAWARKPGLTGKDDAPVHHGRAQKIA